MGDHTSDVGEAAAHAPGDSPRRPRHRRQHCTRPHLPSMRATSAHSQHANLNQESKLHQTIDQVTSI